MGTQGLPTNPILLYKHYTRPYDHQVGGGMPNCDVLTTAESAHPHAFAPVYRHSRPTTRLTSALRECAT